MNHNTNSDSIVFGGSATAEANKEHVLDTLSDAEREKLRRLLHDGLGQILTSATFMATSLRQRLDKLGLAEAEIANELIGVLKEAIQESHTIATRCKTTPGDTTPTSSHIQFG